MFQKITLIEFMQKSENGSTSLLFVNEQGCRYCELAETEIKKDEFFKNHLSVKFFEASINDEPGIAAKLGLVGVPAFLKIDGTGRKRIKTGFDSIESLTKFISGKDN